MITALPRTIESRRHPVLLGVTLLALLALDLGVRRYLDESGQRIGSFLTVAYPQQLPAIYAHSWWEYLLPMKELSGSWSTTGLLLVHGLEHIVGKPHYVFYLGNALQIAVAFLLSWSVWRSYTLSTTLGLSFALSTHNHHVYCVSGTVMLPFVISYLLCFLYCQVQLFRDGANFAIWIPLGLLSLIVYMLSYESWLDCFVYLWLAYPCLIVMFRRRGDLRRALIGGAILAVVTAFAVAYLVIKTKLGFGQSDGSESDVVFNYHGADRIIGVEDVISHYFTIFYIGLSNFLPPQLFVDSVSSWYFGNDHLVGLQNGYHSSQAHLVIYNHVFLWRYYAGFALAVVCLLFYKAARAAYTTGSPHALTFALILLMILTAGPTHILVKWRPMHVVPTLGYHAYLGVVGVALLLAYSSAYAVDHFQRRWVAVGLVALCWLDLGYAALARPSMLSHMNAMAGLPAYPDAMKNLRQLLSR